MALVACNDEPIGEVKNDVEGSVDKQEILSFLTKNAPIKQSFTKDSDNAFSITTKGYLVFGFGKSAFKTKSGDVVTGSVDISITEYLSNADIIYGGVTTATKDKILQSGGMFQIVVTQHGEELELNTKQYDVQFPTDAIDWSMQIFKGEEITNENGEQDISWEENYDSWVRDDSINRDTVYRTKFGFLNWGNLDKYSLNTTGSTIHLKLPEIYTNKNTLVYVVMADRSINYMYSSQAKKEFYSKQYLLPANMDFKILVISSADGTLKHKLVHSKVVPNHLEIVTTMDDISEVDLDQVIQNI